MKLLGQRYLISGKGDSQLCYRFYVSLINVEVNRNNQLQNMYRTSVYINYIKLKESGRYMLLHGYTGAMDEASNSLVSLLKSIKNWTDKVSLPFTEETTEQLIIRGYLTSKTEEEEKQLFVKTANILHKAQKKVKNFLFLVTYNCNFRCPYCYENKISNFGKDWAEKTFSKELVDKAYATMQQIEPNTDMHSKVITLYGGEPLLYENKEIVKYIVDRGCSLGYTYSAITNGYDLEYFSDLLGSKKIERLQITLDGVEQNHNKRRIHKSGKPTFTKILENIDFALKNGVKVNVRFNADKQNIDDIDDLHEIFMRKGFLSYRNFFAYSALIENGNDNISNKELSNVSILDRSQYFDKYSFRSESANSFQSIRCQDYGIQQLLRNSIIKKEKIRFKAIFCGAQNGMIIFDPNGDLYNCWETVGNRNYAIGHYDESLCFDAAKYEMWVNTNVGNDPKCSKCKMALFCGGGCMAKNIFAERQKIGKCDYMTTINRVIQLNYSIITQML